MSTRKPTPDRYDTAALEQHTSTMHTTGVLRPGGKPLKLYLHQGVQSNLSVIATVSRSRASWGRC